MIFISDLLDTLIAYSKQSIEQQSRNLAANKKKIQVLVAEIKAEQDKQERQSNE